jgi:hypothetical protein
VGLKKILLFVCLVLGCCGYCYGQNISITADYTHYDKYRDVLIAKGHVVVKGPDFRIQSPYVIRYFKDEKIQAMDRFVFEKEGYSIAGSSMEYYYWKNTGNAERVRIDFGETFLGGRYMTLDPDKFEIYDGYFTGCSNPPHSQHYHISAQQVTLYPETGVIVAYYSATWVWIAPVIPVPTFVYSAPVPKDKFARLIKKTKAKNLSEEGQRQKEEANIQQPVPEIGANPVDGTFIRQGFNWYFTPRSYAKTLLSYSGNNHFGASLSGNYILNDRSEGELRIGSDEMEGGYGGWTHYFSLGNKLLSKFDEDSLIYEYYKPGGKYAYELELQYSSRERPHLDVNEGPFTRVSSTPKVTLRSNRQPLPLLGKPFTYYMEASTATVSEEVPEAESPLPTGYITSGTMTNYYADILYSANLGWLGKFNAGVDAASSHYTDLKSNIGSTETLGTSESWDRAEQKIALEQKYFDHLTLTYAHSHYINQQGFSPYLFEGYWYSPFDTFTGSVKWNAWWSYLSMKTSYELPSWDLFKVDYEMLLGMHCYNLVFSYILKKDIDKLRSEFNFSFQLVPSRWQ